MQLDMLQEEKEDNQEKVRFYFPLPLLWINRFFFKLLKHGLDYLGRIY